MPEREERIKRVIDRYCFDHNLVNRSEPVDSKCFYWGNASVRVFAEGRCRMCERNNDLAQMIADCVNSQKEVK